MRVTTVAAIASLAAAASMVSIVAYGQTPSNRQEVTHDPRPIPRTSDGHISFAGTPKYVGNWIGVGPRGTLANPVGERGEGYPFHNLKTNISDADVPFKPWARKVYEKRSKEEHKDEPYTKCKPTGGPRLFVSPYGYEFIDLVDQKQMIFVGVAGPHTWRRIYMDGRSLPKNPKPTRLGYSVGHWEGDTLVIESDGYTTNFWLGRNGYPHTKQLHLTERISRPSFNRLVYRVTVDDPGAYTRPWSGGFWVGWMDGNEPFDFLCQGNNVDPSRMSAYHP